MYFNMLFTVVLFAAGVCSAIGNDKIYLEKYLQPTDVGRNLIYDSLIDDGINCARDCTEYPQPRICYYKFIVEEYHAMGPACKNCTVNRDDCFSPQCVPADGIERTVLTFNRLLPGINLHVCYNDRIIVDVQNKMPGRDLSVHWHGILQKNTPYMDGVPWVTQCPIPDNTWFRYDFPATTTGTHFYHSHSGFHLFDGLSGALVIRTSAETDPFRNLYDYDLFSHTIHIQDWLHEMMDDKYPGYNKNITMIGNQPNTYLINGLGGYFNPYSKQWSGTPFAEFHVKPNKRYRFRIISVTSTTCSSQFTIEGHSMTLIATDGYPIQPKEVRTLYMTGGDIYDVIITTNKAPRPYWIRVQGVDKGICSVAFQQAVLKYEGSLQALPSTVNSEALFNSLPFVPELNNLRKPCLNNADNLCLNELQALNKVDDRLLGKPYKQFVFVLDAHSFTQEELFMNNTFHKFYLPISGPGVTPLGGMFSDTMNNITHIFPPFVLSNDPKNPLLDKIKCPDTCDPYCECVHLIKLPSDEVIEMVFIDNVSVDTLKMDHPFHIHGNHFTLMKTGSQDDLKKTDPYTIDPDNEYPLVKDTVPIPASGFAVTRFITDNPGFWVIHCHFQIHNVMGMVIILQVGEPSEMIHPPVDWPKCGNYLPPVHS